MNFVLESISLFVHILEFPGLKRIEPYPIPINKSIIYLPLQNISDFTVQINRGEILGYVKEATYGVCAFLAWDEEKKKILVKSNLIENKYLSEDK